MTNDHKLPQPLDITSPPVLLDHRAAIAHHMAALEELADPGARTDGWMPFARNFSRWGPRAGGCPPPANMAKLMKLMKLMTPRFAPVERVAG